MTLLVLVRAQSVDVQEGHAAHVTSTEVVARCSVFVWQNDTVFWCCKETIIINVDTSLIVIFLWQLLASETLWAVGRYREYLTAVCILSLCHWSNLPCLFLITTSIEPKVEKTRAQQTRYRNLLLEPPSERGANEDVGVEARWGWKSDVQV